MSQFLSYSKLDQLLIAVDEGLRTLSGHVIAKRPNPAAQETTSSLSESERKESGALMRIDHVGEVCAQALYVGQALTAHNPNVREVLYQAAGEESDHLAWCQERLKELSSHTSYLNPLWFLGALTIGMAAGLLGDKWSLGFVAETEHQVEKHLKNHLEKLLKSDLKSRAILQQMCEDEAQHANVAKISGAAELPELIKIVMSLFSKVMTTTAYWV